MKAFVYDNYGGADQLYMTEVDDPIVGVRDVLVRNKFISLNPYEWHFLGPTMFFIRFSSGLLKPKESMKIMRADIAGIVESVGKDVVNFKPGDRVFGRSEKGGYGELVSVSEDRISIIPETVSFEDASGIALAGVTAIQSVRDHAKVKKDEKVLVNGASGGIGTFVVQFCKYYGANVTGVCSTKNIELVRSLGANEIIDYKEESVLDQIGKYDKVIDCIGNLYIDDYKKILKENGKATVLGFTTIKNIFGSMLFGGKQVKTMDAKMNKEDLNFIVNLISEEELKVVIDKVYDFQDLPKAMQKIADRRAAGKLIIKISDS